MKLKNVKKVAFTAILSSMSLTVFADNVTPPPQNAVNLLTGDTRLACEALLCLSSGTRPSECRPPIQKYFSIRHKKLSDTLNARRSFLNLCPTAHDSSSNMPTLVNAIVNGAGRCDADYLNANNISYRTVKKYKCSRHWHEEDCGYTYVRESYINPTVPNYCKVYSDHEYTYNTGVKYVNGRFVNQ